jgi:Domain of unknown function (DUF4410)
MRPFRFLVLLPFVALSVAACPKPFETLPESQTEAQSRATATAGAMTVYVSDFDLDVVQRKPAPKPAPRTSPPSRTGSVSRSPSGVPRTGTATSTSGSSTSQSSDSSDTSPEETPAEQANALVRAVSENIIRALTEAGYDVRRLPAGAPLPQTGLRIRGVFAEADEQNRARRLLVGGEPVGPNIILYVGVNNLKTREQPLYELASPPAPDPRHGPVITVTSYAPAERFELSRDPSADELKSVATKVAADLTALVSANRLSLTQ